MTSAAGPSDFVPPSSAGWPTGWGGPATAGDQANGPSNHGGWTPAPGYDPLPDPPRRRFEALGTNGLLLVGAAMAIVGIALGVAARHQQPTAGIAGWLAASLGCIGCVAAFSYRDAKRRTVDWVLASEPRGYGRLVVLGLGVGAIVLNAWQFADWAAR
jgi:hypothetical protein